MINRKWMYVAWMVVAQVRLSQGVDLYLYLTQKKGKES
jgi:hypothetical protein